ncbi:hypothetical protein MAPG_00659 [Magnaporthiopsis poae ATCC 64411]|uniref:Uncharacterized protein n=1 Tax=Magnaporthiopsis poae (strain ATCC 64411 / 73-15) TaxID=644358 RepID=A0A0C4DLL5_MAGP6|nr:hypothetical protein MAPG_00659 [Magnaporthiopsis poae ATCC 64411]
MKPWRAQNNRPQQYIHNFARRVAIHPLLPSPDAAANDWLLTENDDDDDDDDDDDRHVLPLDRSCVVAASRIATRSTRGASSGLRDRKRLPVSSPLGRHIARRRPPALAGTANGRRRLCLGSRPIP